MCFKFKKIIIAFVVSFITFIIVLPSIAKTGVIHGLIICSNVIIPSLYPFTVCILILLNCGVTLKNKFINSVTYKIFGLKGEMILCFIFSLIGGYPIGAKLISELHNKEIINKKIANIMLLYCVNAGPAFIISAIGCGVYNSQLVGVVLYLSHVFSSIIMAFACGFLIKKEKVSKPVIKIPRYTTPQLLIKSVSDASQSILMICGFVILFSCIGACLDYVSSDLSIIKYILAFTEITSSITNFKNVYLTSFLLAFSGFSIWCQVFSLTVNIKINYVKFIIGRIMHAILSMTLTKFFLNVFEIKISTYSNGYFKNENFYSSGAIFVSIFIMLIVLITFIYTKNNSGKIIKDVI